MQMELHHGLPGKPCQMTKLKLVGKALCLVGLYVGVLLLVVEPASTYCTDAAESQGAWVFLTLLSPPILLIPLVGLAVLLSRPMGFAARCVLVIGVSCLQVLVSFVLFCGFGG
jgi:hypothetical protein